MVLGAIGDLIPKIEGFQPLPSHAAEAFMVLQGGQMALDFGAQYTIGKRLIASMSNEEFNKGKTDPSVFTNLLKPHHQEMNRRFEESLRETTPKMQQLVMEKAYEMEIIKINQNVELIKALPETYFNAIFNLNNRISNIEETENKAGGNRRETKTSTKPVEEKPTPQNVTPPVILPDKPSKSSAEIASEQNVIRLVQTYNSYVQAVNRWNPSALSARQRTSATNREYARAQAKLKGIIPLLGKARTEHKQKYGVWI